MKIPMESISAALRLSPELSPYYSALLASAHATTVHEHAPAGATQAIHAVALDTKDGKAPDWVQLIPAGTFAGVDGRGPFQLRDVAAVIAASKERGGDLGLPIDYGHAMESDIFGPEAMGAEAAGWIMDLEARDGSIWGKVEWVTDAAEKIAARKYRGFSPVFMHDAEGVVLWIARGGLTNRPNLRIKSLNSQHAPHSQENEVTLALKARLCSLFGLTDAATDEETVIARCSAALEAERGLVAVAAGLKLAKTATPGDVITAVNAAQTAATAAPDPSKYVPMETYTAVNAQLLKLRGTEGDRLIADAIKAGKISPAQKDHFTAWHASDPVGAAGFLEKAVPVVKPGEEGNGGAPTAGEPKIDDAGTAVCAALELDEKKFVANIPKEIK